MEGVIDFDELRTADLIVDAVYKSGPFKDRRAEPLHPLLSCGNEGGFRTNGGRTNPNYVVLDATRESADWPDYLDLATGLFTYFGDNKEYGRLLHETSRGGNKLLADVFGRIHATPPQRTKIPPFFVFTKARTEFGGRAVQFRGLAAPGAAGVAPTDDLVAVWKSGAGNRFQNYQALFTVLNVDRVPRTWLDDLLRGDPLSANCPAAWRAWVQAGKYLPLVAEPVREFRLVKDQLPLPGLQQEIVATIYDHFKATPTRFEHCAAELARLLDRNIVIDRITRPSVDGGRDAIGRYRLGPKAEPILVDFALEAKLYDPSGSHRVGVGDTSRLISRLRHRQFGILVTTSAVGPQAYKELREDRHPVIILCGRDIAELLIGKGINSRASVLNWLLSIDP